MSNAIHQETLGEGEAAAADTAAPPREPPSLWAALMLLVQDVRESLQGRIRLFSLELKKAGAAIGQIVALGLLVAFMAHAAWFTLVIGIGWMAIELGAPWWAVMIGIFVVHLAIAAAATWRLVALARTLGMPATMRHLVGNKSHHPMAAPGPVPTTSKAGDPAAETLH